MSTSGVQIAQTNLVGIVPIGDASEDTINTNLVLPSVYEGSPFSLTLTFTKFIGSDENGDPADFVIKNVNCLTSLSNFGASITKTTNTSFSLSGSYFGVIEGAIYNFVMRDGTVRQLPANTTEDYRAIIKFRLPSILVDVLEVNFSVTVDDGEGGEFIENVTMEQYVHYSYTTSVSQFRNLVASRP